MKKYSIYIWAFVVLLFISFIGLMSYWYPVTLDEYFLWQHHPYLKMLKVNYFDLVPRIGTIFSLLIFATGKWFFVLSNIFIQFANCLCIFYILFLRLPNIKDLQDMPYMLMIICLSLYLVCVPSEVMFWLSGSIMYSWPLFFFLLVLCFLRQILAQKFIFQDNWFIDICLFFVGIVIGMSNEALSPVALGFVICFGLFCNFRKIIVPRALSSIIFGVTIGCLIFFSAPAHYKRMTVEGWANLSSVTLGQKLFFHIFHLNEFFKVQFFLPMVTFVFLLIAFLDKARKRVDTTNLWFSLVFLTLLFLMSFVLFAAPSPPLRAYYHASVMGIIAFLFLVRYYIETYKYDFSKILCYFIVALSLFITPRFVLPHYILHLQEKNRNFLISVNKSNANLPPYFILKGPTKNLSIGFTDFANREYIGNGVFGVNKSELQDW